MTVYVDNMLMKATVENGPRTVSGNWSHLIADTDEELIAFALSIGLRKGWIQHPGTWKTHFDVVASKRKLAIKSGAVPVEAGQMHRDASNTPWLEREGWKDLLST